MVRATLVVPKDAKASRDQTHDYAYVVVLGDYFVRLQVHFLYKQNKYHLRAWLYLFVYTTIIRHS